MSKDHLAKAREYIAKGDGCYAKAAEELIAAKVGQPDGPSYREAADAVGKSSRWCRDIVHWRTIGADTSTPWAQDTPRRQQDMAKQVLRNAPPEQIAKLLDEPRIRANVSKAQTIAAEETVRKSREAQREALGKETSDGLDEQQRYHDAEAELFKARRGLIETLRILNDGGIADMRDSWREEFLLTLDDISAKADLARAFLTGSLDEELEKLLEA